MKARTLVPVEEYLGSVYEPDCDYVDGELEDRNVGEKDHGLVQKRFLVYLDTREALWGIRVLLETRICVTPTRYRIPDLCAYIAPEPPEQVPTTPPFLCIEVLSPEDRMSRMSVKIADYLHFGVRYVWVIDPATRMAFEYTAEGMREVRDGVLRAFNPDITVPLAEIFADLLSST